MDLDALLWVHSALPPGLHIHCASVDHLRDLGWIQSEDADQTGARQLLARTIAKRFSVELHEVVFHPAIGHPNPRRARAAWATSAQKYPQQRHVLWTSLARCGPLVIVATATTPVGIDLEHIQSDRQAADLLRLLHPADQEALQRFAGDARALEITAAWSRKEAMLKATGTGLRRDPSHDAVGTQDHPRSPRCWDSMSAIVTRYQVSDSAAQKLVGYNRGGPPSYVIGVAWYDCRYLSHIRRFLRRM